MICPTSFSTASDVAELGEGLTEVLKRVARWVKINKLSLNVKKTKLL